MADASALRKAFVRITDAVDRRSAAGTSCPSRSASATLFGLRDDLREKNLFDAYEGNPPAAPPATANHLTARTIDGSYNDLSAPSMGMAGTRFGRNVPLERGRAEVAAAALRPEPAHGQQRAAAAHRVQAGHDAQRARRGLAAVRDPRLVQPRQRSRTA